MALMVVPVALVVRVWNRAQYIIVIATLKILCLTVVTITIVTMAGILTNCKIPLFNVSKFYKSFSVDECAGDIFNIQLK